MKLNYTSLQHSVEPVETPLAEERGAASAALSAPVLVLPLHGHLAPAAWAAASARPGLRVGYVQTAGGALPGSLSRDVAELRERGLLAGHVAAGPAYGAEHEAISTARGARRPPRRLGWDAVLCGPGPGILGSATEYGHGGIAALENAHAALALGLPTLVSPRISSSDPRPRHRGLSHHTATVLELLLGSVRVPVPEIELAGWPTGERGSRPGRSAERARRPARGLRRSPRRDRRAGRPRRLRAPAGCPRGRWGGRSRRTRCSSPPPLAAGAALADAATRTAERWRGSARRPSTRASIATVRVEEFRHPDGSTSVREVIGHPGAVAMVAHDERFVYLVRQPREAVGEDALLELPAGKLDVPGREPARLRAARARRGGRQVGVAMAELKRFYTSPGFARGGGHRLPGDRTSRTRAPRRTRRSGSRSCPGRSRTSTGRSRSAATRSR